MTIVTMLMVFGGQEAWGCGRARMGVGAPWGRGIGHSGGWRMGVETF